MAEYISKEKAIKELREVYENEYPTASGDFDEYASHDVPNVLRNMSAADVQPVKRGYWIKQPEKFQIHEDVINSNYLYLCSCCNASDLHSERANNDGEVKFCWRCGAKMDAEPDEPWQSK